MKDLKDIFSQNLIKLRKQHSLTQAELAEKLNYSDKAVSKWERAEAIPDIYMLKQISIFFNITLDELLKEHDINEEINSNVKFVNTKSLALWNHILIILISVISIWALATVMFVIDSINQVLIEPWLWYVIPIPVSFLVAFILSCIWMHKIVKIILLSGFCWTSILLIYLLFVPHWEIFLIGIPVEIVIGLCYGVFKIQALVKFNIFKRNKNTK